MNQYASFFCCVFFLFVYFGGIIFHCMFMTQFVIFFHRTRIWGKISIFRKFYPLECKSMVLLCLINHQSRCSWELAVTYNTVSIILSFKLLRCLIIAELLPVAKTLTLISFRHTSRTFKMPLLIQISHWA